MWEWRTMARSPTVRWAISGTTDSQEIQGALEFACSQAEVAGSDRWDEAVVERLRDPQRRVHAVPAEPDRELVSAQPAGVEEAEHLDGPEVRRQERQVLLLVVFAQVPGIVGLLRAGRREGEPIRSGDVGSRRDLRYPLQEPVGLVDVL